MFIIFGNTTKSKSGLFMRKGFKFLFAVIIAVIGVVVYLNSNFYISKQSWKYSDGFRIVDWIEFNKSSVRLKGRKIYLNGEQVGVVRFCYGRKLVIYSIKTGETGYYVNKS
jgi:hypothetical protein